MTIKTKQLLVAGGVVALIYYNYKCNQANKSLAESSWLVMDKSIGKTGSEDKEDHLHDQARKLMVKIDKDLRINRLGFNKLSLDDYYYQYKNLINPRRKVEIEQLLEKFYN